MYLLDSDTLSHLHAGQPNVARRIRESPDPDIAISIVTRIEVLRARFEAIFKAADGAALLMAQERLQRNEQLLNRLLIVPFDAKAGNLFDQLRATRGLKKKIGRADLLIASVALSQKATLVTRNTRHFNLIPNLRVENWVD